MIYIDTSFLAPLLIPEETSGQIHAFLIKLHPKEWRPVIGPSSRLRLLARRVWTRDITEEIAKRTKILFPRFVEKTMAIFLPQIQALKQALGFLRNPYKM